MKNYIKRMNPIYVTTSVNLDLLKKDILEAKEIIKPNQNRYDILFDSKNILSIVGSILKSISNITNESFEIYIKNIQSYIQTNDINNSIYFEKALSRDLVPTSKYSFIFMISSDNTNLHFKSIGNVKLNNGELIVFKTEDFLKDEYDTPNRIALIGSLTNDITSTNIVKTKF